MIGAGGGAAGFGGGYGAGAGGPDGSGYGGVGAPGTGAGPGTGKPSFFKTTGGIAALVAGALAVVGGGIALAVSGGGGGGGVVDKLQGTWHCATKAGSGSGAGDGTTIAVVVGDGTFSAQGLTGVWKVSGGSLTAGTTDKPTGVTIKGIPDGYGPVHATAVNNANPEDGTLQMDGTVSQSALDLKLTVAGAKDTQQNGELFELTCTR